MIKYGLPILAVLALVFAMVSVVNLTPARPSVDPPSPPPSAAFPKQIGAVGLVEARSENIAISVPVFGLVTSVHVQVSDPVKKGQALFSLDDRDLRAELELRRSSLQLAKARSRSCWLRRGPRTFPQPRPASEKQRLC